MALRFAYNTNGLQSHRLEDALALLAEAGYDGVALTLDHMHLDPLRASPEEARAVARLLGRRGLACAVETGARFALDPKRKHRPTLCDPDPLGRMRRVDWLVRGLDLAAEVGAEAFTVHAGPREPGADADAARAFLLDGLQQLAARASARAVPLSLEPEPGHWVETLAEWREVAAELPGLGLTLDVAHVSVAADEGTAAEAIRTHAADLAVVHLEDAPAGVHAHLPFGAGDLDLPAVLAALRAADFRGLGAVELSRHSHAAHELVGASLSALRAAAAG